MCRCRPPTLTNVAPNQGIRGATVAVTLTGTNFVVGATKVIVSGARRDGQRPSSSAAATSLTANFVLDLASAGGPRTVTVTTAGGTSGGANLHDQSAGPVPRRSSLRAVRRPLRCRPALCSITIVATGAGGGAGAGPTDGAGGLGGRTTATVSVTPGASLTVRVGGVGPRCCESRRPAASTAAAEAPESVAGAGALRACMMAPPRS